MVGNNLENIIDGIKELIVNNINYYIAEETTASVPLTAIESKNVVLYDLDFDKYTYPIVIFLVPDAEIYEPSTMEGDTATTTLKAYIATRKAAQDTLFRQCLRYTACLFRVLYGEPTIGGTADDLRIVDCEYYNGIEANADIKVAEVTINLLYQTTIKEIEDVN